MDICGAENTSGQCRATIALLFVTPWVNAQMLVVELCTNEPIIHPQLVQHITYHLFYPIITIHYSHLFSFSLAYYHTIYCLPPFSTLIWPHRIYQPFKEPPSHRIIFLWNSTTCHHHWCLRLFLWYVVRHSWTQMLPIFSKFWPMRHFNITFWGGFLDAEAIAWSSPWKREKKGPAILGRTYRELKPTAQTCLPRRSIQVGYQKNGES